MTRTTDPPARIHFDQAFPGLLAFLLFLAGLLIHLRLYPIGNLGVETDFYGDLAVAARKLSLGQFSLQDYPHKGPLYPLLLAGVHSMGLDWYRAGVSINLLSAAGSVLLMYRLLLWCFHRPVAVFATTLVSLSYVFFIDAHKATTDPLFLVLSLATMSLVLGSAGRWRRLAGAAVLSGLAILTRYNAAFLPVATLVIVLVVDPGKVRWSRRASSAAIYLGILLLTLLPWFAINLAQTGRLATTQNLANVTMEFYPDQDIPNRPTAEFRTLGQIVARDPLHFVRHYLFNIPRHFWLDQVYILRHLGGLLALVGILRLLLVRPSRRQWAFFVFGAVYAASMAFVFYLPRFRAIPVITWYAVGLSVLFGDSANAEAMRSRRTRLGDLLRPFWVGLRSSSRPSNGKVGPIPRGKGRVGAYLAACVIVLPTAATTIRMERVYHADRPLYILDAARFLKRHDPNPGTAALLALKPHLPFLSGIRYQGYPWKVSSYLDLLRHIQATGVRYVALGDLESAHVPGLQPFVQADSLPGLRRIYHAPEISIYEVPPNFDPAAAAGAIPLASVLGDLEVRARHLAESGDRAGAEEVLLDALRKSRLLPQTREVRAAARALRGDLAVVWLDLKKNREAATLLQENLQELASGQGAGDTADAEKADAAERAQTLYLLALHEEQLQRISEARRHLEEAIHRYRSAGDSTGVEEAERRLGVLGQRSGGRP